MCIALILSIMLVNEFPNFVTNPLSQSTAFSQSYNIWHDSTGYYVISGSGSARYPLHTSLLNVSYGCYKFSAVANIFTKTISLNLTTQPSYICNMLPSGGRNG